MQDARDNEENDMWINGDGHAANEPHGIISGVSNVVTGTGTATFAVGDPYALENAIRPRFKPRTRYIANSTIINQAYRLIGGGSTEPPIVNEARDRWLGKPLHEVSSMPSATSQGTRVVIAGDFQAGYVIVDRLGMQVEVVQHLFGANRRPTGQRGFLAISRTSGEVVNANALRALVKP
jgi:HK97 family phage major capsid protein